MLNPKIIYIAVAMVFIYLVAKFKLLPYLAARRILKDAGKDTAGQTPDTADVTNTALLSLLAANAYNANTHAPLVPQKLERHDMYFDYCTVETATDSSKPASWEEEAKKVDVAVNQFLLDLKKRGICPGTLSIVPLCDGLLMVYATYIL